MQLVELIKLLMSIRKLSKVNKNWVAVKKIYIHCLSLIISISITRYLTESLMCLFTIFLMVGLLTHPPVFQYLVSSGVYSFLDSFIHFQNLNKRYTLS